MSDFSWSTFFESRTKEQWIQKIQSDHNGTFPEGQLVQHIGEGLHSHAVLTREDIKHLPHLSDNTAYKTVLWDNDSRWKICVPIPLYNPVSECISQAQQAIAFGAESLLLDNTGSEQSLTDSEILHVINSLPNTINLHVRNRHAISLPAFPQPNPTPSISIAYSTGLPDVGPPINTHLTGRSISTEQTLNARTITCWIPQFGGEQKTTLGELLVSIRTHLNAYPALESGMESFIRTSQIVIATGSLFYPEIARIRALKHVLRKLVADISPGFVGKIDIPIIAEIHPKSSPDEGISAVLFEATTRALSAIIGGCDSLIIRPSSVEGTLYTPEDLRLTTNIQLILRHESYLDRVADPGAGSYYIEWLTHQLIENAWHYYEEER